MSCKHDRDAYLHVVPADSNKSFLLLSLTRTHSRASPVRRSIEPLNKLTPDTCCVSTRVVLTIGRFLAAILSRRTGQLPRRPWCRETWLRRRQAWCTPSLEAAATSRPRTPLTAYFALPHERLTNGDTKGLTGTSSGWWEALMSFPMMARVITNRRDLCTFFLLSRKFLFVKSVYVKYVKILEFFLGGGGVQEFSVKRPTGFATSNLQ